MILVQFGYKKSPKEWQKIDAFRIRGLNKIPLTWNKGKSGFVEGEYITELSKRFGNIWYIGKLELEEGESLALSIATGMKGLGPDESRSMLILCSRSNKQSEIKIRKVGDDRFPLVSGKFTEIARRTCLDERLDKIESLLASVKEEDD